MEFSPCVCELRLIDWETEQRGGLMLQYKASVMAVRDQESRRDDSKDCS